MSAQRGRGSAPARVRVTVVATAAQRPAARGLARWLERAVPPAARGAAVVALVGDGEMRRLNREFRGVDRATDVLSFPATAPGARATKMARRPAPRGHAAGAAKRRPDSHLGDIAIGMGVARRQAARAGHTLGVELRILALHGFLHLLGYDHDRDDGEMRIVEERLRRRAGLPAGLISRSADRNERG